MGIHYSHSTKRAGRVRKEQAAKTFIQLLEKQGYKNISLNFDKLYVYYECLIHGMMIRKNWPFKESSTAIEDRRSPACWHCGKGHERRTKSLLKHQGLLTKNHPHIQILEKIDDSNRHIYKFKCIRHFRDFVKSWNKVITSKHGGCKECVKEYKIKKVPYIFLTKLKKADCSFIKKGWIQCNIHNRVFNCSRDQFSGVETRERRCCECRTMIVGDKPSANRSFKEAKLFRQIKDKIPNALASYGIRSSKKSRAEVDIFIEEMGIGIEYNGTRFHSSIKPGFSAESLHKLRHSHSDKFKLAKSKNIRLLTIWEHLSEGSYKGISILRLKEELKLLRKMLPADYYLKGNKNMSLKLKDFYDKTSPIKKFIADYNYFCCDRNHNILAALSFKCVGDNNFSIVNIASKIRYQSIYRKLFSMFIKQVSPKQIEMTLPNDWYTDAIPTYLGFREHRNFKSKGFILNKKKLLRLDNDLCDKEIYKLAKVSGNIIYFDSGSTRYLFKEKL